MSLDDFFGTCRNCGKKCDRVGKKDFKTSEYAVAYCCDCGSDTHRELIGRCKTCESRHGIVL